VSVRHVPRSHPVLLRDGPILPPAYPFGPTRTEVAIYTSAIEELARLTFGLPEQAATDLQGKLLLVIARELERRART
jgi:hypothetical protein